MTNKTWFSAFALLLLVTCVPGLCGAQAKVHAYAVVVGSNLGGAGQGTLSYAERDAEQMAELLAELGRTPRDHIQLLARPRVHEVEAALERVRRKLEEHASRGERTQVVFYYSGHARAHALSLGREELGLDALRGALVALPSTLTVVVLDACQSGAFSGVKGAAPAADFSVSSVNDLHSEGIAVMASSTAAELSQESRELGSSYFSHHLAVALRGAGDGDGDGRVSLDEAYRYAYQNTLADTARTQVGSQHATLETELKGRGDVPLSYPADADAQLLLPAPLEGRVLVQKERRGAVMAELIKAQGSELRLALPSDRYEVVVRKDGAKRAYACEIALTRGETVALMLERCREVRFSENAEKGGNERYESWFVELGIGANGNAHDDAYIHTLHDFRFDGLEPALSSAFEGALGLGLHRNVALLARFDELERRSYDRDLQGPDGQTRNERFGWTTRAVSLGARARVPLFREWIVGFVECDAGLGFSRSKLSGENVHSKNTDYGVVLRGSAGLTFGVWKYLGLYLSAGYTYAPVLSNRIGETHDDGGMTLASGIRIRGIKGGF